MARWTGRSAAIPGAFGISPQTFEDMETLISSLRKGSREFQRTMRVSAHLMAKTTQAHAQRLYRGPQTNPRDARRMVEDRSAGWAQIGTNPGSGGGGARPWTIPVRRITGRTYRGWRVKPLGSQAYECFNEERGAYMVEFGIVRGGGGVRRPILRLAGNAALLMARQTKFGNRVMQGTFGSLQMNRGQFTKFNGRMEGSVYLMGPI